MTDRYRNYPCLGALDSVFRERYRFSRDVVDRGFSLFGDAWASEFEELLRRLFPGNERLYSAAKGYSAFAMSSMRLQAEFEKTGNYRSKSFAEAADAVYFNEDRMMNEYLPGLQLSHYLWPHHFRQLKFFDAAFVEPMRVAGATDFVEIGVGTGVYSQRLLRSLPLLNGRGFDISAWSKAFAEMHIGAYGLNSRYAVTLQDIVAEPLNGNVEWLVCVEVLEHLEDPLAFLRALRKALAPGGKAFITAAINAAHDDHICLYRGAGEVARHVEQSGFAIEQSFVARAYIPNSPSVPVPEAVAFVVQ